MLNHIKKMDYIIRDYKQSLENLKALTAEIIPVEDILVFKKDGDMKFRAIGGEYDVKVVYETKNIQVLEVTAEDDVLLPYHLHEDSAEILIVHKGQMILGYEKESVELKDDQSITIPKGVPHFAFIKGKSLISAILFPQSDTFKVNLDNRRKE